MPRHRPRGNAHSARSIPYPRQSRVGDAPQQTRDYWIAQIIQAIQLLKASKDAETLFRYCEPDSGKIAGAMLICKIANYLKPAGVDEPSHNTQTKVFHDFKEGVMLTPAGLFDYYKDDLDLFAPRRSSQGAAITYTYFAK